jgi:Heavy metal associated domain 2
MPSNKDIASTGVSEIKDVSLTEPKIVTDAEFLKEESADSIDHTHAEVVNIYNKIMSANVSAVNKDNISSADPEHSVWTYTSDLEQARRDRGVELDESDEVAEAAIVAEAVTSGLKKAAKKKSKKKSKKNLKLQIAHQTVGRVRMKLPSAKGEPDLLKDIAETFSIIPGIERVEVNSITGSIILHYDEGNKYFNDKLAQSLLVHNKQQGARLGSEYDELAKKIQTEAEFLAQKSETAKAVVDFFKRLDREVRFATYNVVDLKIILAVGAIALMIFEIGATAATPVWLTLAIFTFNHFIELRNPTEEDIQFPANNKKNAPIIFEGKTA